MSNYHRPGFFCMAALLAGLPVDVDLELGAP